jgi:hypothetical protein
MTTMVEDARVITGGVDTHAGETGCHPELSQDERAGHLRRTGITFAMLPATRYPRLVEGEAAMASCDPDLHYRLAWSCSLPGSGPWPCIGALVANLLIWPRTGVGPDRRSQGPPGP